jgi:hypothetical protein
MTFENAHDFLPIANTYSLDQVLKHWNELILTSFFDFDPGHRLITSLSLTEASSSSDMRPNLM